MLTTRIADVAYASDIEFHSYVHRMLPLSSEESWNLFVRKTFKDNSCPSHLKDVAKGILRNCEGLPLAIVTISGVLALKDRRKIDDGRQLKVALVVNWKSRKQQFATIATRGQDIGCPQKVRRLAIHASIGDTQENICCKHLRSLVTFSSLSKSLLSNLLYWGCRMQRALVLEGTQLEEIPDEIYELLHLRSLNLQSTRVKTVSKSIGRLQKLEYLNLAYTKVTELPVEILKLQGLHHLSVYGKRFDSHDSIISGVKSPNKVGRLLFLERLSYLEADRKGILVREIGELKQLKTLGITNIRRQDGIELLFSLEKLKNLEQLYVQAIEKDEIIDLNHSLSSSLQFLQVLCLRGHLEKVPQLISSLQSLTIVSLFWSGLMDDPLESLQHLPNLQTIYLNQAYEGDGFCFKAGCFLKLEQLVLISLNSLKWLHVEEGAMPKLRELRMTDVKFLEEFPFGIQHLMQLQSLYLNDMSNKLIAKLQNLDEESEDHANLSRIPRIFIWTDKDGYCRFPLLHNKEKKKSVEESRVEACAMVKIE
ncbi:hypothetical protein ACH5RR_040082 [Cinchona calisaya]|uniref:Disease resistance R13L4/SHOC-2-like LRR domain-containing protein n=1 Tax=Cinchona calisaya TaxID=153742 RepID=A0ABD2XV06_9GENT